MGSLNGRGIGRKQLIAYISVLTCLLFLVKLLNVNDYARNPALARVQTLDIPDRQHVNIAIRDVSGLVAIPGLPRTRTLAVNMTAIGRRGRKVSASAIMWPTV